MTRALIIKKLLIAMTALLALLQAQQQPPKLGGASIDSQLVGLTSTEKADIKSNAIVSKNPIGTYTDAEYGLTIEIQQVNKIDGGVEVFARAWRGTQQLGFGDGTVDVERFRIFNPPILIDDPLGTIVREWTDKETGELKQRKLREDPAEATKKVLAHTISVSAKDGTKIIKGKIGKTTDTFYPDADTGTTSVDGWVRRSGASLTWSDVHDGAGNGRSYSADPDTQMVLIQDDSSTTWARIHRGILLFNTTSLGSDTINSATMSIYGTAKVNSANFSPPISMQVYSSSPAANTTLTDADYGTLGTTAFSTAVSYASFSTTGYNDFALNASGLAAIVGGITKLGIRDGNYDGPNTEATHASVGPNYFSNYTADQTGTTNDPKLVVTHTASAAPVNNSYIVNFE